MKINNWVSFLVLYACSVMGQAAKLKTLLPEDYHLWGTLRNEGISSSGNWVSYGVSYESGADTLFVKESRGEKRFSFPNCSGGKFIEDVAFCCLRNSNTLQVRDLKNYNSWNVDSVARYEISKSARYIVLIRERGAKKFTIEVRDQNGSLVKMVEDVSSYAFGIDNTSIAYCRTTLVEAIAETFSFGKDLRSKQLAQSKTGTFQNFCWQKQGTAIGFVHRKGEQTDALFLYNFEKSKLFKCVPHYEGWSTDARRADNLIVAGDGNRLLFTITKEQESQPARGAKVQVWNAADRSLYSHRSLDPTVIKWMQWEANENRFMTITEEKQSLVRFTADSRFAIYYDDSMYVPSGTQYPERLHYFLDLHTGSRSCFETTLTTSPEHLKTSPRGMGVTYFADGDWLLYSPTSKTSVNLSDKIRAIGMDGLHRDERIEFAAWSSDARTMMFYDSFDIWTCGADGNSLRKTTDGRKSGIVYRLNDDGGIVDPQGTILKMRGEDHDFNGYAVLANGKVTEIASGHCKMSGICSNGDKTVFSFISEDFDIPPSLIYVKGKRANEVYKSNTHADRYRWGESRQLKYQLMDGTVLNGVLCYPASFDPALEYPMIVHIYERQANLLHGYANPTLYNTYGFNTTHFTSQDYFVFFPDIDARMGEPGKSILECTVAGVNAVLQAAPVDKTRIGLIGHSFGGYGANFIITQTGLFKCAVSGAGISDYVSSYFSEDRGYHKDSYWRFETDQRRAGSPFFNKPQTYHDNSPIYRADAVTTPLLQFSGGNDLQVNPSQSFEFHLALRRLQKENTLLFYPTEGHVIVEPENQVDLTKKVTDWFAFYLKGEEKPKWMLPQ